MPEVKIPLTGGTMPAWLAVPSTPASVPGVVVLHDIFGMSQDNRNQADWLAEAGFLALAPDLYHRGGKLHCIRAVIRELMARSGAAFDDVEASRSPRHELNVVPQMIFSVFYPQERGDFHGQR
jgi:carboxymethylenebutenolidase